MTSQPDLCELALALEATSMAKLLKGNRLENWIGGARCAPSNGQYLESINPSTGKVWAEVPGGRRTEGVEQGFAAAD